MYGDADKVLAASVGWGRSTEELKKIENKNDWEKNSDLRPIALVDVSYKISMTLIKKIA